jgi:ABC-type lipoprotein export system ATPase subunit|tara:strand:- start:84225 stop:84542 length:318 start_codon:yes stop_codon:yes gene_type:complete
MAHLVFIVGESGAGKSTSLRTLNPDETVIVNTDQKALPFRKYKEIYNEEKGNYIQTSNIIEVVKKLSEANKNDKIKTVIVDTWSRIMTDAVMSKEFRNAKNGMQA